VVAFEDRHVHSFTQHYCPLPAVITSVRGDDDLWHGLSLLRTVIRD
jgi:hypothetical protein